MSCPRVLTIYSPCVRVPLSTSTIIVTFAFGLAYIVSFIVSIPDFNNTTSGPFALSYNPAAQIFWDVFETRYGNGRLCNGLWCVDHAPAWNS